MEESHDHDRQDEPEKSAPADNLEMKYWHAVSLANTGRLDDALPLFATVFESDERWRELTRRIRQPAVGILDVSDEDMERILGAGTTPGE